MIYDVERLGTTTVQLGRRGENLANAINIDVSAWLALWPDADISVIVLRPGETVGYPAENISVADGVLSWAVTEVETAIAGIGSFEVRATAGDVLKKSVVTAFEVCKCITCDTETDEPPEPVKPWYEQVMNVAQCVNAVAINCTSTGEIVTVNDSAAGQRAGLTLYGKTTQAATPTPDAPAPLVHVDGIGIKVTGKNILPLGSVKTYKRTGITFTLNDDGTYTVDGTATANTYYAGATGSLILGVLPAGKYSCSVSPVSAAPGVRGTIRNRTNSNAWVAQTGTSSGYTTFTADGVSEYSAGFFVLEGDTVNNLTFTLQVEYGETATEHEAYAVAGEITYSGELRGIPVTSGGNHVDASGQHWIADYIDIAEKSACSVLGSFTLDGSEGYGWAVVVSDTSGATVAYTSPQDKWSDHDPALTNDTRVLGTHFVGGLMTETGQIKLDSNFLNMSIPATITTSDEFNAWLSANPVTVLYVRKTPVRTALVMDDITLPAPNATAYNDGSCSMHLAYVADTKLYIDNRIAALAAATLNA